MILLHHESDNDENKENEQDLDLTPIEEAFQDSSHSTVHSIQVTPFTDLNTPPERVQVHIRLRPFLKDEEKTSSIEFCNPDNNQITSIF